MRSETKVTVIAICAGFLVLAVAGYSLGRLVGKRAQTERGAQGSGMGGSQTTSAANASRFDPRSVDFIDGYLDELPPLPDATIREMVARMIEALRTGGEESEVEVWQYLKHLSEADIPLALELVTDAPPMHAAALEWLLVGRWAQFDARAALDYAQDEVSGMMRAVAVTGTFLQLAESDPADALEWILYEEDDHRFLIENSVGTGLEEMGFYDVDNVLGKLFSSYGKKDLAGALQACRNLPNPGDRARAFTGLADNAADPVVRETLMAAELPDGLVAMDSIAGSLARRDPDGAIRWLVDQGSAGEIVELVSKILSTRYKPEGTPEEQAAYEEIRNSLSDELLEQIEESEALRIEMTEMFIDSLDPATP